MDPHLRVRVSDEVHLLELSVEAIKKRYLEYEKAMKDMKQHAAKSESNCNAYKTQLETVTKQLKASEAKANEPHADLKNYYETIIQNLRNNCRAMNAENKQLKEQLHIVREGQVPCLAKSLHELETENEALKKELEATKEGMKEQMIHELISELHSKKRRREDDSSHDREEAQ